MFSNKVTTKKQTFNLILMRVYQTNTLKQRQSCECPLSAARAVEINCWQLALRVKRVTSPDKRGVERENPSP